jgi:hypothetical protein
MRKTLTLFIDLEGAAAQDPAEVAELLRQASNKADRLYDGGDWTPGDGVTLIDSNGNRVGQLAVEER